MRIESTGVPPTALQTPATRQTARVADTASTSAAAATATTVEPGSAKELVLSGRLAALLAGVRQAPDVRPNVVTEATTRLAAGDFTTPEAAAAAAAAIAQTLPHTDAPVG